MVGLSVKARMRGHYRPYNLYYKGALRCYRLKARDSKRITCIEDLNVPRQAMYLEYYGYVFSIAKSL